MSNEKRDKLIVEALGGCWHECGNRPNYACLKCGETVTDNQGWYINPASGNIDLSTPSGFFWAWDRLYKENLHKQEENRFVEFIGFLIQKPIGTKPHGGLGVLIYFISNRDLFMDALAEFLEGRK